VEVKVSEIVAAVLGAILGAVLASYLNFVVTMRSMRLVSQTELTIKLYEEWQGFGMLEARIRANEVLREHSQDSFSQLYSRLVSDGRHGDWNQTSRVIHFFELIGMLLAEDRLDRTVFRRLFGRYIHYWRSEMLDGLINRSETIDRSLESGWAQAIKNLDAS
jgi:hypothetical protein